VSAVRGAYYDGKSSLRREAEISLETPASLRVKAGELDITYPLRDVEIAPRVGNTRRSIRLPDGGSCETDDNDSVDAWLEAQGRGGIQSVVHRLESKYRYALLALVLTVVIGWTGVQYGIPALAKQVAFHLPESTESALGERSLEALDQFLFDPSQLPELRRQKLTAMFGQIARRVDPGQPLRLELRHSERIGANAFALPSGVIVMTDGLVNLAHHDNEIIAVLAHEIGHVLNRHTLRHALQNSATVLLIAAVTGDITSVTAFGAALPTMLLQAKYSRAFEIEADDILLRLEDKHGGGDVPDFLSTHPASKQRAQRFINAR